MKRIAAASGVFVLLVFGTSGQANAADCQQSVLGLVCSTVQDAGTVLTTVTDSSGKVVSSVTAPIVQPSPATVTVPGPTRTVQVPGPTKTVEVPGPERTVEVPVPGKQTTVTVTKSAPGSTATVTATPTTVTETVQANATGQPSSASATLSEAPTLATPPPDEASAPVGFLPKSPSAAAAQGSFFGILLGIILGIVGLFIAYRRGQKAGEKATLLEFLGVVRGVEPIRGRHRVE